MARKSKKDTKANGNGTNGHDTTPAPPPEGLPKDAKMRGAPFSLELAVKNSEHQQAVLGGQLSNVILEKGRVEAEKLAVLAAKKEEIGELDERISDLDKREHELARDVHNGTHKAPVQCATYLLPDNRMRTVRLDTGEQVGDDRVATADDLQDDLFPPTLDGPKTEPEAPEGASPPANDGTAITAPQDLLKPEQPAAPAGE